MRTGWRALILLGLVALAGADELDGTITGGKAKRLVDKGVPLIKQADEVYKRWVLEEIAEEDLARELKRAIRLYDEGTALLQEALDIQHDAGVNHQSKVAARRLQKMRYYVSFRLERPAPKPPSTPPEKPETPETPETQQPPPPEPGPPPRTPVAVRPTSVAEDEAPSARVQFEAQRPPAMPRDLALPRLSGIVSNPEQEKLARRDRRTIARRISDYFSSFKRNKLRYRHRLCGGKGVFSDGAACEECCGTGEGINLHHFRKAYWTSFTPLLRDAEGALTALKAYHEHARRNPDALGPVVKSFKVEEIDYQGIWARARVALQTSAGSEERVLTLISIGSSWYFYHPDADAELLPKEAMK